MSIWKRTVTCMTMLAVIAAAATLSPAPARAQDIFTKQNIGGVLGAVGGGILGSKFGKGSGKTATTILGAVAGAGIGGYIGGQFDENDRYHTTSALNSARDNQPVAWKNPNSGQSYRVVPTKSYHADDGQYCREYSTSGYIDGQEQTIYGTACRQPDGSWQQQQS